MQQHYINQMGMQFAMGGMQPMMNMQNQMTHRHIDDRNRMSSFQHHRGHHSSSLHQSAQSRAPVPPGNQHISSFQSRHQDVSRSADTGGMSDRGGNKPDEDTEKNLKYGLTMVRRPLSPPSVAKVRDRKRNFAQISSTTRYQEKIRMSAKKSSTNSSDWSSCGRWLLVTTTEGLRLLDTQTYKEHQRFEGEYADAVMDPMNEHMACISYNGSLKICNQEKDRYEMILEVDLKSIKEEFKDVTALAWSHDGKMIAIATKNDVIGILSVSRGENSSKVPKLRLINYGPLEKEDGYDINSIVFDQSGDFLWIACGGSTGKILRRETRVENPETQVLIGHRGSVTCISAAPKGDTIITSSSDGTLSIWDAETATQIGSYTRPEQGVTSLSVNSDGTLVAWACSFSIERSCKKLYVMHVPTRKLMWVEQMSAPISHIKFSPGVNKLVYFVNEEEDRPDRYQRTPQQPSQQAANIMIIPQDR